MILFPNVRGNFRTAASRLNYFLRSFRRLIAIASTRFAASNSAMTVQSGSLPNIASHVPNKPDASNTYLSLLGAPPKIANDYSRQSPMKLLRHRQETEQRVKIEPTIARLTASSRTIVKVDGLRQQAAALDSAAIVRRRAELEGRAPSLPGTPAGKSTVNVICENREGIVCSRSSFST